MTTPRSFHSTLDCAAMRLGVATSPSPSPTTKQLAAASRMFGVEAVTARIAEPMTVTEMPIRAVALNPIRR